MAYLRYSKGIPCHHYLPKLFTCSLFFLLTVVLLLSVTLAAPANAHQSIETQERLCDSIPTCEDKQLFEHTQKLLDATPQLLKNQGYIKRFPFPVKDRVITGIANHFVIPGAILFASNFSLGFFSHQLNQVIPNEPVRMLAIPTLSYVWDQVLSPSQSLCDALRRAIPALIDGTLIIATQNSNWGGKLATLYRASSLLYSGYRALEKDIRHEYNKWQNYNSRPINLEGQDIPENIAIHLERTETPSPLGKTRLIITIPPRSNTAVDPSPPAEDNPARALNHLVAIAQNKGIQTIQLYPSHRRDKLELYTLACRDKCPNYSDRIPLPPIQGTWWTTLAADFSPSNQNTATPIVDPLSPVLLNAIAELYKTDKPDTPIKPLTVDASQLRVQQQAKQGLSILSAKGHFNIWLVQGESSLIPGYQNAISEISLQATETFQGSIRNLSDHIEEPLLPGWSHLPIQLARVFALAQVQSWGWNKGVNFGTVFEAGNVFQGMKRKWRKSFIPTHTDRIDVVFEDGKSVTGNLLRSSHPQHKLVVVFHPTRASSDDFANSGYFGLTELPGKTASPTLPEGVFLKQPTELGQYLNDQGFDVFIPEYRGYKNDLMPAKKDQFYADMETAFDTIIDHGKKLYESSGGYQTIHVVGYSIGATAASHIANVRSQQIKNVTLLAPFHRLADVAHKFIHVRIPFLSYFLKFPMDNQQELEQTTVPVHILHGAQDTLVSPDSSHSMATHLKNLRGDEQVHYQSFDNLGHEGLLDDKGLITHMIDIFAGRR